jgi:hypothetical protein
VPEPPPAAPEVEDPLAFTPVVLVRVRHDGWTPRRQHDFIAALAAMGSVSHALRAVGMTKQSAYTLRGRPGAESFAAAWDIALQMGYDRALHVAIDRATNGVLSPHFYRGKLIGMRHRFDYRLAHAALRPPPAPPRNKVTR